MQWWDAPACQYQVLLSRHVCKRQVLVTYYSVYVYSFCRYWCALACVSVVEAAAGPQRFPGYHHAKLLLLLWLQSARYQGAARLYRLLLRPALEKLRPSMEAFLARAAALAVRTCTSLTCTSQSTGCMCWAFRVLASVHCQAL